MKFKAAGARTRGAGAAVTGQAFSEFAQPVIDSLILLIKHNNILLLLMLLPPRNSSGWIDLVDWM